jgi:predicted RNA-binding protein YlxR (DUF448 family)
VREKRDLVRVVRTPEGEVRIDPTGRCNGRGAYLCRDWNCLRAALKRKGFERAFKGPLPPDAASVLEAGFRDLVPVDGEEGSPACGRTSPHPFPIETDERVTPEG